MSAKRILFLFVDGVGLGEDDPARNAFVHPELHNLRALLDGRALIASNTPWHGERASLVALDATLGMPGLPQSGTGQTSLLTGQDAVRMHGRHFGPWVPSRLRTLLREQNILTRAVRAGHDVAFANAYPASLIAAAEDDDRLPRFLRAGPPLAALGAGLLTRDASHLARGDAIASEITNDGWRKHLGHTELPDIDAETAGANLARIAHAHDLTLFAHYSTDTAGHRRDLGDAHNAMLRLDAFLGALVDALDDDVLTVLASDHGNLEDCTTAHTRNPAIGLVIGSGHAKVTRGWGRITDVVPSLGGHLGIT